MKKLMFLLIFVIQTMPFIKGSEEKPEGPITNLPNEILEKMALDIIIPQINNAKNLVELENVNKNALTGFALSSKQHLSVVKDARFVNRVKNAYEKRKKEILENIQKTLNRKNKNVFDGYNIIEKGINEKKSPGDATPLISACMQQGYMDIAKLLIENGADINLVDYDGSSALQWAIFNNDNELIKFLINNGANVNNQDKSGDTLLMEAVKYGKQTLADLLIKKGADINAKDKNGNTALIKAIHKGNKEMVELLLKKGAQVNIRNNAGQTAYDIVKKNNDKEMMNLLTSDFLKRYKK